MKSISLFFVLLTVLLVGLKLTSFITWSWYFVFGAVTIPLSLIVGFFVITYIASKLLNAKNNLMAKIRNLRFKKMNEMTNELPPPWVK